MKFEAPIVEVKKFDVEDVLTTSTETCLGDICLPLCPENNALPCVGD